MFGLFKKDPTKELEKLYAKKLEEAMHAQRNGKMAEFANLSAQADQILKKIENLQENNSESHKT